MEYKHRFFATAGGEGITQPDLMSGGLSPSGGVKLYSFTSGYVFAKASFYAEFWPISIDFAYSYSLFYSLCLYIQSYTENIQNNHGFMHYYI
jgi:hypothetical protein